LVVNFRTILASSLEPLNQFEPDLANQIWLIASMGEGNKNCEFHSSCPPGALGMGQKLSKIDQFSKIFLSTTAQVEEN
jgi:hypothetical protein